MCLCGKGELPGWMPCCARMAPPIGLKPKYIHDEQRREEIREAIGRYVNNDKKVPVEWIEEFNALCNE